MAKPNLLTPIKWQQFDNSGLPLTGGFLFFYNVGTTTKCNTYPTLTDAQNGTNANPNPIVLNSAGRPANGGSEIDIYVTQAVKVVCSPSTDTDPPQNPLWTELSVTTLGQTVTVTAKSATYAIVVSDRDALLTMDASGGNKIFNLPAAATAGNGFTIQLKKIDSSSNTVTITPNGTDNIDGANTSIVFNVQNDYVYLVSDGTQWFKGSPKNFTNNITLYGGLTSVIADGTTLGKLFFVSVDAAEASLASAGKVNIITASGTQQFKVRNIYYSVQGSTNFSGGGGDRLIAVTDGTTVFSLVPAASAQTIVVSRWGDTALPFPASAKPDVSTAAGANLYLQYSGGTTDYTAGSLHIVFHLEKVA